MGRATQDVGREIVLKEGESGLGREGNRERPINFSSASGMTNECFSKGPTCKV